MPRDANGIYSLPNGYLAVSGTLIQASQHNPPLEDLAAAMTGSLPRSGVAPMTGPLLVPDGSANAPALCFASDPSVGFYKSGNTIVSTRPLTGSIPIGLGPLPWSLSAAPAGWVLCYGQTLSRVTYAALWAIAQTEIAAGNTFFNNGNGVDTFGIGDMRGRVAAGKDDMGGTAAGRLTASDFGADPKVLGAGGGDKTSTLVTANLPPYTPSGSITNGTITIGNPNNLQGFGGNTNGQSGGDRAIPNAGKILNSDTLILSQAPSDFTGTAQGGTSTPISRAQPTLITNYILYAGA